MGDAARAAAAEGNAHGGTGRRGVTGRRTLRRETGIRQRLDAARALNRCRAAEREQGEQKDGEQRLTPRGLRMRTMVAHGVQLYNGAAADYGALAGGTRRFVICSNA